jgi:hypothetical protein
MENQIDSVWTLGGRDGCASRARSGKQRRHHGGGGSGAGGSGAVDGNLRPPAAGRPRPMVTAGEGAGPWTASASRREAKRDGRGEGGRGSVAGERRPLAAGRPEQMGVRACGGELRAACGVCVRRHSVRAIGIGAG